MPDEPDDMPTTDDPSPTEPAVERPADEHSQGSPDAPFVEPEGEFIGKSLDWPTEQS